MYLKQGPLLGIHANELGEIWAAPSRTAKQWRRLVHRVREGYAFMKVYDRLERKYVHWAVHRYVCWTFLGPPPFPWYVVRHMDSDPLNNSIYNLKWGTKEQNDDDKVDNAARTVPLTLP
jgi:hypothetical protein